MTVSTVRQTLWAAGLAVVLVVVAWTTRYRVVTTEQPGVVLYDRWMHRLCLLAADRRDCGVRLP